jgi:hypothetical protein
MSDTTIVHALVFCVLIALSWGLGPQLLEWFESSRGMQ